MVLSDSEGETDGISDGLSDGEVDGLFVDDMLVGAWVSPAANGDRLGCFDGDNEGWTDGEKDGSDGPFVGDPVVGA